MDIPSVTVEQMRQVDKSAPADFGLSILMMMENASIHIADLAQHMLSGKVDDKNIVVMSHKGNNGGDGLGAARHLIHRGATVTVISTTSQNELTKATQKQYRVLQAVACNYIEVTKETRHEIVPIMKRSDLIIDGLLGYNIIGKPKSPLNMLIMEANASKMPILSIDIPSGLDGNTGMAFFPTIQATSTLTLALPKIGLLKPKAQKYVGELWLADLSIPDNVYRHIGIEMNPLFTTNRLFQLK